LVLFGRSRSTADCSPSRWPLVPAGRAGTCRPVSCAPPPLSPSLSLPWPPPFVPLPVLLTSTLSLLLLLLLRWAAWRRVRYLRAPPRIPPLPLRGSEPDPRRIQLAARCPRAAAPRGAGVGGGGWTARPRRAQRGRRRCGRRRRRGARSCCKRTRTESCLIFWILSGIGIVYFLLQIDVNFRCYRFLPIVMAGYQDRLGNQKFLSGMRNWRNSPSPLLSFPFLFFTQFLAWPFLSFDAHSHTHFAHTHRCVCAVRFIENHFSDCPCYCLLFTSSTRRISLQFNLFTPSAAAIATQISDFNWNFDAANALATFAASPSSCLFAVRIRRRMENEQRNETERNQTAQRTRNKIARLDSTQFRRKFRPLAYNNSSRVTVGGREKHTSCCRWKCTTIGRSSKT